MSVADLVDRLGRFEGPPDQFLAHLLSVQCVIAGASNGAIFRADAHGQPQVLAVHPPLPEGAAAPQWLAQAAQSLPQALSSGTTLIRPVHAQEDLYGAPPDKFLIMLPLRSGGSIRGLAAFHIETTDGEVLQASRQRLELTASLLSLYEMRLTLQHRQADLQRMRRAMEVLSAVNEPQRFAGAGMALCNDLSARWECHRVGLGFLKGRYVHLKSLSHTEKFSRKMSLVQQIEAAMEECLDQDVETVFPPVEGATYVCRAEEELSRKQGPSAILCLPLRVEGEAVGAICLERPPEKPFAADEIEAIRLTCDLTTARIAALHEHDRWFGAKAAASARKLAAVAVGAKHTWAKLIAIACCGLLAFLFFAKGEYQAEGPVEVQTVERRVVSAPFDGFLEPVKFKIGDTVNTGDVLATFNVKDLQNQLDEAQSKQKSYAKQAAAASEASLRDPSKRAEAQALAAQAEGYAAQAKLLHDHISRAEVHSPIDGKIVAGELDKQSNPSMKTGDVMFEIAPVKKLRGEIAVPEDQIADVHEGSTGELATAAHPEERIAFTVDRINPVAELVDQKNVFKVRVKFSDADAATVDALLRPGMRGVAHVDVTQRTYAWLWTHKLINWVRMKLWI